MLTLSPRGHFCSPSATQTLLFVHSTLEKAMETFVCVFPFKVSVNASSFRLQLLIKMYFITRRELVLCHVQPGFQRCLLTYSI